MKRGRVEVAKCPHIHKIEYRYVGKDSEEYEIWWRRVFSDMVDQLGIEVNSE